MRQSNGNLIYRSNGENGASVTSGSRLSPRNDSGERKDHSTRWPILFFRPNLILLVLFVLVYCAFFNHNVFYWTGEPLVATKKGRIAPFQARPPLIQLLQKDESTSEHELNHAVVPQAPQNQLQNVTKRAKVKEDSDVSYWSERRPWPRENCTALGDWMTGDNSNCNTFHEIDMTAFSSPENNIRDQFRYIKDGGFRTAWMTAEYNGDKRVVKTLRYVDKRPFDLDNLERHRRDALAIEQLTHSPYIADIYGHCAQSALVDYSPDVTLYHIFDDEDDWPDYDELFQISYDAVAAVADCHHFNKEGKATIVNKDIKPNQWIFLNGRFVLNDFNLSKFLSFNPTENRYCGRATGYSSGRWQAPEQVKEDSPLTVKEDVYSLGNVLYYLLTEGAKPFEDMSGSEAFTHLGEGGTLKIDDDEVLNSKHPFHVNVIQAMNMCLEHDPAKRPDARQVRDFLRPKLDDYIQQRKAEGDARIKHGRFVLD